MQNFMITLLICSVAMSGLALLYMAAAPFLARRYSEKWRYYAWLIIIVGLIIPFRPGWGNALINVEVPAAAPPPIVQVGGEASSYFMSSFTLPPVESVTLADTESNISWWHIGFAVWLTGAMVFIAVQGIKHYRFNKAARRWGKSITDTQILSMLESLKSEMGISRKIPIYLCSIAGSPMMVGLLKPRILLPRLHGRAVPKENDRPTAEPAQDELRLILKHELVHYKRKDLLYKYLVLTATALHWFNPIVYLMAKAVNALCETSCDAEVLRSADVETRQFYGETIIGVVKYQSKLKTALSTNFYGGKKGMKKRIASIMDTRKKGAGIIITCLVLMLAIGTGFIFAASPTEAQNITENTVYNTDSTEETAPQVQPPVININDHYMAEIEDAQTNPAEIRMDYNTFRAWVEAQIELDRENPDINSDLAVFLAEYYNNALELLRQYGTYVYVHHNGSFYIIRLGWEHIAAEWNIGDPSLNIGIQPGLMPGERELEPGESWPLADNHMIVELFDNNGDVGVRHSADGGETWVDGPAVTVDEEAIRASIEDGAGGLIFSNDLMSEQEAAELFGITESPWTTRGIDFDDIEGLVGVFSIPPNDTGE